MGTRHRYVVLDEAAVVGGTHLELQRPDAAVRHAPQEAVDDHRFGFQ